MGAPEVLRHYGAAWSRNEPEAAFAWYDDQVVMRLPGRGSLAGEHRGKAAVISTIRALLARTDGSEVEVEAIDQLVSESRVALLLHEAVTRGEQRLELRRVNVYRVSAGKIVAIDIFEADQYDVDAFFG